MVVRTIRLKGLGGEFTSISSRYIYCCESLRLEVDYEEIRLMRSGFQPAHHRLRLRGPRAVRTRRQTDPRRDRPFERRPRDGGPVFKLRELVVVVTILLRYDVALRVIHRHIPKRLDLILHLLPVAANHDQI